MSSRVARGVTGVRRSVFKAGEHAPAHTGHIVFTDLLRDTWVSLTLQLPWTTRPRTRGDSGPEMHSRPSASSLMYVHLIVVGITVPFSTAATSSVPTDSAYGF